MRQPIAEAMVEEATRPTMRFVALKFEAQQARAMLFRTRQMFIGQRTQTINALRGHLAEHGVVEPKGAIHVKRLADAVTDETIGLPEDVRELAQVYLAQIEDLNVQITALDQKMKGAAKEAEAARRAQTMPGVGPITALAIETFAPDLRRTAMKDYIGLDVSMKETAISIRRGGARVWRGKFNSDPARIAQIVRKRAPNVERVVFETGPLSVWFYHALKEEGLPAICIDARHGKAALDMAANKTDANDADGLAQLAEVGFYREVRVKGYDSMLARSLIAARTRLVRITVELSNQIRGLMKTFGLIVPSGKGRNFDTNVRRLLVDQTELSNIILPLLYAWHDMRMRAADLTKLLLAVARKSPACRLLMTIPGVGAITATSYATAIEDPSNFKNSRAVGAWLGLTSRRYQSGEVDYSGRVSRRGDRHLRGLLYEAALVILTQSKKQSDLQTWALKLKERVGTKRAAVALARKLAVTMHAHAENRIRVQS